MATSSLQLSISVPGSTTTSPLHSSGGACGMRDFDINEVPSTMDIGDCPEEITGKYCEEDSGGDTGGGSHKKLRLTKEQTTLLEESFGQNHTLNLKQKDALASQLGLKPRQVEVWFQNRRARTKLKQTEVEYEHLKRCFGSLTEENKRLQREVEQLRALRVGPQRMISANSNEPFRASMLTMCPRCERVTNSSGTDKGPISTKSLSLKANPDNVRLLVRLS
ncbi:hypothetical protein IFM89_019268 [Coptis chinensis]|uniref:Homeobox domain-containing protein n=1 Tax=Coptis chinensis TaxID=261450 RepID=A0A835H4X2_9MAGN|nr:hypothetical protein IFM89_019268 [Coptis chinensis]